MAERPVDRAPALLHGVDSSYVLFCLTAGARDRKRRYVFSLLGLHQDLSRPLAPTVVHSVPQAIRENIVRLAQSIPGTPDELGVVGRLMYDFLLPGTIRECIRQTEQRSGSGLTLHLVTDDHELPWELTHDKEHYWAHKHGIGRIHGVSPDGISGVGGSRIGSRRYDPETRVLVISDPDGTLAAARAEGEALELALRGLDSVVEVTWLRGEQCSLEAVSTALSRATYDIVHFAGHADFGKVNCLRLAHGERLEAATISNIDLANSPVVFANACSTGAERYVGGRAAGLASAFIAAGASAYVGTMWPVFDDTAADFALRFYRSILSHESVSSALLRAKREQEECFPTSADWAAFSLYGHPGTLVFSERPTATLSVEMSDRSGTLADVTAALRDMGVNLVHTHSFTIEDGVRAGYIAEVELGPALTADEVCRGLKQQLGEAIISAVEAVPMERTTI